MTTTKKVPPREVPSRDDFYMGMAFWYASKSKDPKTQIGAQIVSVDNRPLGWGYNGPPKQFNDNTLNWDRPDKYDYIEHAEVNAIDHTHDRHALAGSTIYVTGKPCKDCMRKIVKNGIKKVIYFPLKKIADNSSMFANDAQMSVTEEIAKLGGVHISQYNGNLNWMRDRMHFMESLGVFDI